MKILLKYALLVTMLLFSQFTVAQYSEYDWEERDTFHRRVVRDDDAFDAIDSTNARDNSSGRYIVLTVHVVCSKL